MLSLSALTGHCLIFRYDRVSLRATETPGLFHLIMGGQIDYEKVAADREELVKAVKAGTDRDDLEVGEPTWLLETR